MSALIAPAGPHDVMRDDAPIQVFIGFDARETVAFSVLSHSIHRHASRPVSITPLMLSQLRGCFWRPRHALQSTEFSFTRFMTPWLCGFEGWSIFMDCDMLVRDDIAKLWQLRDPEFAVQVVKHDHRPRETTKFLDQAQTRYEKKNWSSVMLFNNSRCRMLTPEYVNHATGLELHQFKWLENDAHIGELPARWNRLVGYDQDDADAALLHFTSGGPYFRRYHHCSFADEWFAERKLMLAVADDEAMTQHQGEIVLPRTLAAN